MGYTTAGKWSLALWVISALLLTGCEAKSGRIVDNAAATQFPVGIWAGTYQGKPISMEFRADGRAIIVYGGEDEVALGSYEYNPALDPATLDVVLDKTDWGAFRMLVKQPNDQTLQLAGMKANTPRPKQFGPDDVVLHRSKSHVMPQGVTSATKRDKLLEKALSGDIWFGGKHKTDMLNICEALYRYQFEHNASGAQQNAKAYFLSVARRDPPEELIKRFDHHDPPVKPGSQFHTGQGLMFHISRIIWLDSKSVQAEGGYYEGGLSSSGNTYQLKFQDGKWQVVKDTMNRISKIISHDDTSA